MSSAAIISNTVKDMRIGIAPSHCLMGVPLMRFEGGSVEGTEVFPGCIEETLPSVHGKGMAMIGTGKDYPGPTQKSRLSESIT
jgi:hypothetical protein